MGDVFAVQPDLAAAWPTQASQHLRQLALSISINAGDSEYVAKPKLQADFFHNRQAAFIDECQALGGKDGRLLPGIPSADARRLYLAPDHQLGQFGLAGILGALGGNPASLAQYGYPVADGHHLAQFVRDKDDRCSLRGQSSQHLEKPGRFRQS